LDSRLRQHDDIRHCLYCARSFVRVAALNPWPAGRKKNCQ